MASRSFNGRATCPRGNSISEQARERERPEGTIVSGVAGFRGLKRRKPRAFPVRLHREW